MPDSTPAPPRRLADAHALGFADTCAARIWWERYRAPGEATVGATWTRVANALAEPEGPAATRWARRFRTALSTLRVLPAGRILAGAGRDAARTLANCFVMGPLEESLPALFDGLAEGAQTLRLGGGVGYDFSTLRPAGSAADATGPVTWLAVWDATCAAIRAGTRRGAMMATLSCDHPDLEAFAEAKAVAGALPHFNLSVLISDAFMAAVRADAEWPLVFPAAALPGEGPVVCRRWPGYDAAIDCRILAVRRARDLWRRLTRNAWAHAEPGVLFVDRINAENNLGYRETIWATNPCGEVPLPAYGACHLGSLNLTAHVRDAFAPHATVDHRALAASAALAVRMLDNAITCGHYPLAAQRDLALATRRIGLGVTGLADALIMLGLRYDSVAGRAAVAELLTTVRDAAYGASVELAREKGPFPAFDATAFLARPFVTRLPDALRAAIARHGLRNSHLLAIAPTGSISLLAGNLSPGIEPVFGATQRRAILASDGRLHLHRLTDPAYRAWRRSRRGLPPAWLDVDALTPAAHLAMQAVVQPLVDNAIAKTVNLPARYSSAACMRLFEAAHAAGLKGLTVNRPGSARCAVVAATR